VALVLVVALGSEAARDATVDADEGTLLRSSVLRFPAWGDDVLGGESGTTPSIIVRVLVLLVMLFLLAAVAGRAGSGGAAFLAGWGAFVISSAVAGAVFFVAADTLAFDGSFESFYAGGDTLDALVTEVNAGAMFGLYTGALVGAAVALTRRTVVARVEMPGATAPYTAGAPAPVLPGAVPPGAAGGVTAGLASSGAYAPAVTPSGAASPGLATGRPAPPTPAAATAPPGATPPGLVNGRPTPPVPVATWPPSPTKPSPSQPSPVSGTTPPSPAWSPPQTQSPLAAAPLPRRGVGSRPVPKLPSDPSESLDAPQDTGGDPQAEDD
jgi:hypothetical protein